MPNVEEMLLESSFGPNSLPVLKRLEALLKEAGTNSLQAFRDGRVDPRVDACLMLLLMQRYGCLYELDATKDYERVAPALEAFLKERALAVPGGA